jgi:hypothetical protein
MFPVAGLPSPRSLRGRIDRIGSVAIVESGRQELHSQPGDLIATYQFTFSRPFILTATEPAKPPQPTPSNKLEMRPHHVSSSNRPTKQGAQPASPSPHLVPLNVIKETT